MTQAIEQVERSANRLAGTGFGLLWMNAVSFQLISSADRFTFTWLIDDTLTGPSWATGVVLFALGLPIFCFVLAAGAIADRSDRRRQLLGSQLAGAVISGGAAALVAAGWMTVPLAIVTAFCFGTAYAFAQPVRSALVPALVPRSQLMRAIVMMTIGQNIGFVIGPALGGAVIDAAGVGMAFAVQSVLFIAGYAAVFRLRVPPRAVEVPKRALRTEVGEGLRFVWQHPCLRPLFFLLALGGLFMMGSSSILIPKIARQEFGRTAGQASLLFTFMGIGMVSTSLVLARFVQIRRRGLVFMITMIVGTGDQIVQGFAPSYAAFAVLLFVWGITGGLYVNLNQSLIQSITPVDRMGRVMGLFLLVSAGLAPLGSLLAGTVATYLGPQPTLGWLAVIACACSVITLWRAADLRALA